ncbi:hypothetical protein [Sphaerospermopsis torques-reginae]|uniref:Uncharacterized protein n=1 Tax=Sphaerospermopsis torques-reginae ITEP-024 TaxID=984208 RepID=A0ABX8WUG7_9CYAN|nr:hypothetical protein [Sphaerospermopsis torques-reginae]QYX30064.1 hypothetical protein K2F26_13940 [Sphaerospermopsis torques-reginae ITEP-024]
MSKRFNNLDAALKYLRSPEAAPDAEIPDAPAGTALRKYQDYKAGKVIIQYTRAQDSLPGTLNLVTIKPFGYLPASTVLVRVTLSNRSAGQYSTVGLTEAALGITKIAAENDTSIELAGFKPARCTVRNTTGTSAAPKDSKITGLKYKVKAGATYTFPLGRTTQKASYFEQKSAIIALVETQATRSVSFTPEKF